MPGSLATIRTRSLRSVIGVEPGRWFSELVERNRALLGEGYWANGLRRNRTAVDTYLRYFHEQGLSSRRWAPEEIFAAGLLDT